MTALLCLENALLSVLSCIFIYHCRKHLNRFFRDYKHSPNPCNKARLTHLERRIAELERHIRLLCDVMVSPTRRRNGIIFYKICEKESYEIYKSMYCRRAIELNTLVTPISLIQDSCKFLGDELSRLL